ncbi:MAG: hypothetical protein IMY72_12925, partial [Bacteroidetes bacterium]|nr:hypothetical protein [Bacteroidota bacterium]
MKDSSSNILYKKLDDFIKKYYKNLIIQGLFISLIVIVSAIFFAAIFEYFFYFSKITRLVFLFIIIFAAIYTCISFILLPVLKRINVRKQITYKQAVSIINHHFPEFHDSLLNSLELAEGDKDNSYFSPQLIIASIEQRINNLKPYNFAFAINIKKKFFYGKILFSVIVASFIFYLIFPNILNQGTRRIINYKIHYTKPLPFQFSILNKNLSVHKGSDFKLQVKLTGDEIPNELFVSFRGNKFFMKKDSENTFSYDFQNVNNQIHFKISNEDFSSQIFKLSVMPIPIIIDFNISLFYPRHTGLNEKTLDNVGDFSIPNGTKVTFAFNSVNTDSLFISFDDSKLKIAKKNKDKFSFTKTFYKSTQYSISLKNQNLRKKNIFKYSINVIPDMYPNIKLVDIVDTLNMNLHYFKGVVNDDYGFTNLKFHYTLSNIEDSIFSVNIPINKNLTNQEFYFATDFEELSKSADNINYYFVITDNDIVSGFKSTKSQLFEFTKPNRDSLLTFEKEINSSIEKKLNQGIMLAHELSRDIKEFQKQNINSNLSNWEKKKFLKNIVDKQKELQNIVNKINKTNIDKNNFINSFSEKNKEILDKQKKIDELLKTILNDDIKDLMKQLAELQKKFDKNKINQLSKQLQMSYDDLEKRLDKNLELLKKFQIEQKIDNAINDLKKLSEDQNKLAETTKHKEEDNNSLIKKQTSQSDKLSKIKKDYNSLKKQNSELENKFNLDNFNKQFEAIQKQFQDGLDKLNKNQNRKASQNQSQNSKQLDNLSQSMQNMMKENMQQQATVDIQQLRQILYNLLSFSFDQEKIIEQLRFCEPSNPKYSEILNSQNKQKENFVIIRDSLYALSKRTMQLASIIDKDVFKINSNLEKVLDELENRKKGKALSSQQFIITSTNNLTLFLSEALKSLQEMQKKGSKMGNKSCKKSGKGMPSLSQMRKGQQSLKSQLQNMLN